MLPYNKTPKLLKYCKSAIKIQALAFVYFFPKSPIEWDSRFIRLKLNNIKTNKTNKTGTGRSLSSWKLIQIFGILFYGTLLPFLCIGWFNRKISLVKRILWLSQISICMVQIGFGRCILQNKVGFASGVNGLLDLQLNLIRSKQK